MLRIAAVSLALISCVCAFKKVCTVQPLENDWPDRWLICDGVGYKHPVCTDPLKDIPPYDWALVDQTLNGDPEMRQYLANVIRIYKPDKLRLSETCTSTGGPNLNEVVNCDRVCPYELVPIKTVAHQYDVHQNLWTKCHVISPVEQGVEYTSCLDNGKPNIPGLAANFMCVPENIVRRKIAVFCPELGSKCQKMTIDIPTHSALSEFKCLPKSRSKLVSSFFSQLAMGGF